ncbi:tRNA-uridine aminocarboxypropyltransferase [Shewanella fodinae]|uniref:tRNA-uridine aminocarboxypropyltransferase n=1 Tax=Shewanella fodinae TaxID=552357 RepID=UPI00167602C1|nr:tRNA-uridine aminocarboxypropyltransferase [Shewanella fodinae]MCL2905503.1 DTW domain-containing protein [Shewanella fodinae]GGY91568.1 DTW domain-containing protein [Shewanella fodinae]
MTIAAPFSDKIPVLHAVHRLHAYRQSIATRPYAARGMKVVRCGSCLLPQQICTCASRKLLSSQTAFALVMYDTEVLKPSNSGRLIADLIPDTHAFLWSRTQPDPQLLALLNHPGYQPILVFPGDYALPGQQIIEVQPQMPPLASRFAKERVPLFVLLDGCWREAVKMYRKSPYLQQLPVLSFHPEILASYQLRKGQREFQLGTAEVAAMTLNVWGEQANAEALQLWFNIFVEATLWSRSARSPECLARMQALLAEFNAR